MKKVFGISILTVLALSLLTGCIKPPDTVDPIDEDVVIDLDENYATELKILIPSGNSNETTMIDKAIETFNIKFPNITFKKNYVTVTSYENTVRNQFITNTLPDIVWTNSPDFYTLVSGKIAQPLNKYIEKSEEAGHFNFKNDFLTEYFEMGASKGNYYAVPRSADSVVTFYNKELLTKAGVDLSLIKNGWTWDTFLEVNETYRKWRDANGPDNYFVTDANLTTWLSTSYPILTSYGADVLDESGKCIIDSAETREALTMIRKMMTDRYIVDSGESPSSSFEVGTAPFLFQSASVSLFADRVALKDKIDIVSFPLINAKSSPKIGTGIAGYSMNTKSKQKTAAWQFLLHLMSLEGQNALAEGGLHLPSIRHDLADYSTAKWGEGYRDFNLNAYTYGSEYKVDLKFLSYIDPKYKADIDLATRDLFANATRTDKDIESAIATCVREINAALNKV